MLWPLKCSPASAQRYATTGAMRRRRPTQSLAAACEPCLLTLVPLPPRYTLDNYMRIVTYKTAFYSFYLPVAAGMVMAGVPEGPAYDLAKKLCIEMGQYFQVR
jgi:geranylgeranyl pyrophosphate synthase